MRAVGTITDSPLIKIKGVDVMNNFELKHKEYIDEISSTGYIYVHKCGAKLVYMENDDKNRVYSVDVYKRQVESGVFQADMKVELLNDGPITILLDSDKLF